MPDAFATLTPQPKVLIPRADVAKPFENRSPAAGNHRAQLLTSNFDPEMNGQEWQRDAE